MSKKLKVAINVINKYPNTKTGTEENLKEKT